ncbi:UNVERIFIED_CONTAM: hypothetical protein K2H54_028619 [Gekko kuhli]
MNLLTLSLVAVLVATAHSLVCTCTLGTAGCGLLGTCSPPDGGVCMMLAQKNNLGEWTAPASCGSQSAKSGICKKTPV